MRVIVHDDRTMLVIEEVAGSLHISARDNSTRMTMEQTIVPIERYPLFVRFREVAVELMNGIRPQLDAEITRQSPPRS